jgi:hypothetical protein
MKALGNGGIQIFYNALFVEIRGETGITQDWRHGVHFKYARPIIRRSSAAS